MTGWSPNICGSNLPSLERHLSSTGSADLVEVLSILCPMDFTLSGGSATIFQGLNLTGVSLAYIAFCGLYAPRHHSCDVTFSCNLSTRTIPFTNQQIFYGHLLLSTARMDQLRRASRLRWFYFGHSHLQELSSLGIWSLDLNHCSIKAASFLLLTPKNLGRTLRFFVWPIPPICAWSATPFLVSYSPTGLFPPSGHIYRLQTSLPFVTLTPKFSDVVQLDRSLGTNHFS